MSDKPHRKPHYRLEQLDGEVLLLHPGKTRTMCLNTTAALVWRLCNGEHTTAEIVKLLQEAFSNADGSIVADVEETLQCLLDHQAIEFM